MEGILIIWGLAVRLVVPHFARYTEIPHPSIQMTSVDSHLFGGFADVAIGFGEFVKDELPVVCVGRGFE